MLFIIFFSSDKAIGQIINFAAIVDFFIVISYVKQNNDTLYLIKLLKNNIDIY
jgi:hypothetical protein